jgi:hypothetical protein
MIDKELVGMGWMDITKYTVLRREGENEENNNYKGKVVPKCQL